MKTILLNSLLATCISSLLSCSRCPIQMTKWQTETKSKDVTSQIKSLDEFTAAVKLDSIELRKFVKAKLSGNANVKLNFNLDRVVKKKRIKETIWDKELWQEATLAMNGYCAIRQDLKEGILKSESSLLRAEAQLNNMLDVFDRTKKNWSQRNDYHWCFFILF